MIELNPEAVYSGEGRDKAYEDESKPAVYDHRRFGHDRAGLRDDDGGQNPHAHQGLSESGRLLCAAG